MSDLAAIVAPLIGRPWAPPAFDCWEFLRLVYQQAYGIGLDRLGHTAGDLRADVPFADAQASNGLWVPVAVPHDGDAVAMGRRHRPHHCGLWLAAEGGMIAHCSEPLGVAASPVRALAAVGWGSFRFYRHRDRP